MPETTTPETTPAETTPSKTGLAWIHDNAEALGNDEAAAPNSRRLAHLVRLLAARTADVLHEIDEDIGFA